MESLTGLLIWVIIIIGFIVSALRRRRIPHESGEGEPQEKEGFERLIESMLGIEIEEEEQKEQIEKSRLSEKEETKEAPSARPVTTEIATPGISPESIEIQKEVSLPVESKIPELKNLLPQDLRRAIILQEIFGPPKA